MKLQTKYHIVLLLFFLVLIYFGNLVTKNSISYIRNDYGISKAKLISFSTGKSYYLGYEYKVDSIKYKKSGTCKRYNFNERKILFKFNWPVIYSKKNPQIHELLINRGTFELYGLVKPDSLPVFDGE